MSNRFVFVFLPKNRDFFLFLVSYFLFLTFYLLFSFFSFTLQVRKILSFQPISQSISEEVSPGQNVSSNEELVEWVRAIVFTVVIIEILIITVMIIIIMTIIRIIIMVITIFSYILHFSFLFLRFV